ncbi:MAG: 50S ribosomal protein L32 [Holosporales bacterium]|nr:50S ribosomal protein L32 [Holosporales bacterium]
MSVIEVCLVTTEMAVPKKKTSKSKKGMRRSHDFDTPVNFAICDNCGKAVMQHNVCKFCNTYNGRNIKTTARIEGM